jgi:hypothetical protein
MAIEKRAWDNLKNEELRGLVVTLMKRCTELEKKVNILEVTTKQTEDEVNCHTKMSDWCPHTGK